MTFLAHQCSQAAAWFRGNSFDPPEERASFRKDMTLLTEQATQGVHQVRALMEKPFTCTEKHCTGLLILRLRLDKAHFRALCRDDDRLGAAASFFCRFTKDRTYCGAMSRTSWPSPTISRAHWLALPQASVAAMQGGSRLKDSSPRGEAGLPKGSTKARITMPISRISRAGVRYLPILSITLLKSIAKYSEMMKWTTGKTVCGLSPRQPPPAARGRAHARPLRCAQW